MRMIGIVFLFVVAMFAGCGKKEAVVEKKAAGVETPKVAEDSFRPELLLSDARTAGFTADLPMTRALLDRPEGYVISVKITGECANEKAQRELKSRAEEMGRVAAEVLGSKTLEGVTSAAGKMKLREEILARMQGLMHEKAIKQIYFRQYYVSPPR